MTPPSSPRAGRSTVSAAGERSDLTKEIHAFFEDWNEEGCAHFDRGHGPYRQCEDPDESVPIRALASLLAAASPAGLDVDVLYEAMCSLDNDDPGIFNIVAISEPDTRPIAERLAAEYARRTEGSQR